jgi:hypothetical protein
MTDGGMRKFTVFVDTYCKMKDARERHKNAGAPRQSACGSIFLCPFVSLGMQRNKRQVPGKTDYV